ncbi:MAG TPA: SIS domain-containing protein [candidate division Zixibacteria bacterium]|nr:SIS domain-containing protein [candidate division Zixibacteria bacterium]
MVKIRSRVSRIGYINRIRDNLLNVRKRELASLYADLKAADCVVCGGSGRSLYSLNAAMSQIAISHIGWRNKVVLTPDDPGFPGKNMYDAAAELERRYNKIFFLINSGSGVSGDPLVLAQDLSKYISEKKSSKFSMGLITSNLNSPLAEIVCKCGHVVELTGRGRAKPSLDYSEMGIMGDIFELGSLLLLCMMTEAMFRNLEPTEVLQLCEEEFAKLGPMVDSITESDTYSRLVDILEKRTDVFLGGKGTANEIVKMAAIRLFHLKSTLGDNVYIARGVNTPPPRPGDLEILVSYSGETKPVIAWCDILRKLNGTVLSITGTKKSTLKEKSDLQITLEEEAKPGQPRRFYMRAAYVLSPLPVRLVERLGERGLRLPEYIINWHHSLTE